MEPLNNVLNFLKTIQRVFKIKDSIARSLFSGFLGTLAMDTLNLIFWKLGKTEALHGHMAGSVYVMLLELISEKTSGWVNLRIS